MNKATLEKQLRELLSTQDSITHMLEEENYNDGTFPLLKEEREEQKQAILKEFDNLQQQVREYRDALVRLDEFLLLLQQVMDGIIRTFVKQFGEVIGSLEFSVRLEQTRHNIMNIRETIPGEVKKHE